MNMSIRDGKPMKNSNRAILIAILSSSATVHAAQQGASGATSTGESSVSVTKQEVVMISDIADLDLGTMDNTSTDLLAFDEVCVFNTTANYQITATSSNSAFQLSDGGTGTIPYSVEWADSTGSPTPMSYGSAVSGLLGDQISTNCGGGTNARFSVSVLAADFNNADPGTYSDTLTLMIEPE